MIHHTAATYCPSCEEKLKQAHPFLGEWFRKKKEKYRNIHISWSFRNEAEQRQCVLDGKSKLEWPKSEHNNMLAGQPLSLALDLFQEDDDGNFVKDSRLFFTKLAAEVIEDQDPILWGGRWPSLGDKDHFSVCVNPNSALHVA